MTKFFSTVALSIGRSKVKINARSLLLMFCSCQVKLSTWGPFLKKQFSPQSLSPIIKPPMRTLNPPINNMESLSIGSCNLSLLII